MLWQKTTKTGSTPKSLVEDSIAAHAERLCMSLSAENSHHGDYYLELARLAQEKTGCELDIAYKIVDMGMQKFVFDIITDRNKGALRLEEIRQCSPEEIYRHALPDVEAEIQKAAREGTARYEALGKKAESTRSPSSERLR